MNIIPAIKKSKMTNPIANIRQTTLNIRNNSEL